MQVCPVRTQRDNDHMQHQPVVVAVEMGGGATPAAILPAWLPGAADSGSASGWNDLAGEKGGVEEGRRTLAAGGKAGGGPCAGSCVSCACNTALQDCISSLAPLPKASNILASLFT